MTTHAVHMCDQSVQCCLWHQRWKNMVIRIPKHPQQKSTSYHHPTDDLPLLAVLRAPLWFVWSSFDAAVPLTTLALLKDLRRIVVVLTSSDSGTQSGIDFRLRLKANPAGPTFSTQPRSDDDGFFRISVGANANWPFIDFCICDCIQDFIWFDFFFLRCRFWKSWTTMHHTHAHTMHLQLIAIAKLNCTITAGTVENLAANYCYEETRINLLQWWQ